MTAPSPSGKLRFDELESLYDELAATLDAVPAERESVFLAKLVLSMANEFGNAERISALIKRCLDEPGANDAKQNENGKLWGSQDA
ncbi:MAG: hypothetical protein WA888_20335 [Burkholderiaceae bacterium]